MSERDELIERAKAFCKTDLGEEPDSEALIENYDWPVVMADFALSERTRILEVLAEVEKGNPYQDNAERVYPLKLGFQSAIDRIREALGESK